MRALARILAVSVLSWGCTTTAPGAGSQPMPGTGAAPTLSPSAKPPAPADKLEGTWRSDACGARKYRRVLKLEAGGAFEATDLVSPCPPQVACVWSGIVDRKGKWKLEGAAVRLTVEGEDPKAGSPLATPLGWAGGLLTEGDGACPYTPQP